MFMKDQFDVTMKNEAIGEKWKDLEKENPLCGVLRPPSLKWSPKIYTVDKHVSHTF